MRKTKNVVIKKGCHSRGMLSGISLIRNRKQAENVCLKTTRQKGDPRQTPSGMTAYFITVSGFTLIELLVVVLIIGILAAVAVPQYQKAVEKARAVEAVVQIKNLMTSVDLYLLENGMPNSGTVEDLIDNGILTLPGLSAGVQAYSHDNEKFSYMAICQSSKCSINITSKKKASNGGSLYGLFAEKTAAGGNWTKTCGYWETNDMGHKICKGVEGFTADKL